MSVARCPACVFVSGHLLRHMKVFANEETEAVGFPVHCTLGQRWTTVVLPATVNRVLFDSQNQSKTATSRKRRQQSTFTHPACRPSRAHVWPARPMRREGRVRLKRSWGLEATSCPTRYPTLGRDNH